MIKRMLVATALLSGPTFAAIEPASKTAMQPQETPSVAKQPRWLLQDFLKISAQNPVQLLRIAKKMYDKDRMRIVAVDAKYAHDWQHRLAMVQALSDIFDPSAKRAVKADAKIRAYTRKVLTYAMLQDPSLIVRDGVVESIRRIVRMRPQERLVWKKPLEAAFMSKKNFDQGEGFFIRETILTTLREAAMQPSPQVFKAARNDKNIRVKNMLREWDTRAYDSAL